MNLLENPKSIGQGDDRILMKEVGVRREWFEYLRTVHEINGPGHSNMEFDREKV